MSPVFDAYAAYYDLLYRDKDYAGEADWVDALIRRHRPGASRMLELGCGTGGHALHMSAQGYKVTGADISAKMVDIACGRLNSGAQTAAQPRFLVGDMRTMRLGETFDVVVSLFHVMSYQTSNSDLISAMSTAAAHLEPGGLFVFDAWHGPGVLSEKPQVRVHRLEGDGLKVTRIAEPVHHHNLNRVDVHYEVILERNAVVERVRECHQMRYLFAPEVDLLLSLAGLRLCATLGWRSDAPPDERSWHACFVAMKSEKN